MNEELALLIVIVIGLPIFALVALTDDVRGIVVSVPLPLPDFVPM